MPRTRIPRLLAQFFSHGIAFDVRTPPGGTLDKLEVGDAAAGVEDGFGGAHCLWFWVKVHGVGRKLGGVGGGWLLLMWKGGLIFGSDVVTWR